MNSVDGWTYDPEDVAVDSWHDIPVHHVWQNERTDEVVIVYSTKMYSYVETFETVDEVKGWKEQARDLLMNGKLPKMVPTVTATGGRKVDGSFDYEDEATERAINYMQNRA